MPIIIVAVGNGGYNFASDIISGAIKITSL